MRYLVLLFILSPLISFSQQIFVPNAFTPNNDGINDCFGVYCSNSDSLSYYDMKIFSSDGQVIFKTNDVNDVWMGGVEYYTSTKSFVYQIQYKFLSGQPVVKTGTIYLIR
jgi:gliding motility-associated-like protein